MNPNPLATTPVPPTSGVKLSISNSDLSRVPPQLYKLNAFGSTRSHLATYSIKESENEFDPSHETASNGILPQAADDDPDEPAELTEGTSMLSPAKGNEGLKRRKPKTNLMKSNSSFISRVIPHDALSKRLHEPNPEALFIFANINRAIQWLDLSSTPFAKVSGCLLRVATHAESSIRRNSLSKSCSAKHICCATTLIPTPKAQITSTSSWVLHRQTSCGWKHSRRNITGSIKM